MRVVKLTLGGALLGAFAGSLGACAGSPVSETGGGAGTSGAATSAGSASGGAGAGSGGSAAGLTSVGAGAGGVAATGGTPGGGGMPDGGAAMGGAAGSGMMTGGVSSLCPSNAQLCLDFENGAYDGWTTNAKAGALAVDSTRASHGTKSLLITAPSGSSGGMIQAKGAPLFPLPQNQLWGRMMVYFETPPDGHTDLVNSNGMGPGNYNVGEQHGSIMLNYYGGSQATDCWARPKPERKMLDKVWMCWEWRFDSANNQMDYWMDGTLLRSVNKNGDGCLSGNAVWQAPSAFTQISVGERVAETNKNLTGSKAWIDDVAISNVSRVGCPAPGP